MEIRLINGFNFVLKTKKEQRKSEQFRHSYARGKNQKNTRLYNRKKESDVEIT
jgi:hypothetical protein